MASLQCLFVEHERSLFLQITKRLVCSNKEANVNEVKRNSFGILIHVHKETPV